MKKPGIIVALDVPNLSEASRLVEGLAPHVAAFKVGMELCTAEGASSVVKFIHERGGKVFLDLKFKDIPNTVAKASAAAARLGVWMFNVHASGGKAMMEAAMKNRGESLVVAVTVLTSMNDEDCRNNYGDDVRRTVSNFIVVAEQAGLNGVVCSPNEVGLVMGIVTRDFLKVTPGVRPLWAAAGDQKRVMTPEEAMQAGSDYLVIGRPITNPPIEVGSPTKATNIINQELEQTLG